MKGGSMALFGKEYSDLSAGDVTKVAVRRAADNRCEPIDAQVWTDNAKAKITVANQRDHADVETTSQNLTLEIVAGHEDLVNELRGVWGL